GSRSRDPRRGYAGRRQAAAEVVRRQLRARRRSRDDARLGGLRGRQARDRRPRAVSAQVSGPARVRRPRDGTADGRGNATRTATCACNAACACNATCTANALTLAREQARSPDMTAYLVTPDSVDKTIAAFTRLDQRGDKRAMNKLAQRLQKEQPFLLQH